MEIEQQDDTKKPKAHYQDLVILCSPLLVAGMADAFRFQIKHARWDAVVLWSGSSLRYGQGVIVLEWYEPIPAEFVKALQRDAEAIDYFFYDVPIADEETINASHQAAVQHTPQEVGEVEREKR